MTSFNTEQKKRLFLGSLALLVLLAVMAGMLSYSSSLKQMEETLLTKQDQLREIQVLRKRYVKLKEQAETVQKQLSESGRDSTLTFLEELAVGSVGRENLVLMRPLPSEINGAIRIDKVEFKIERLVLQNALEILSSIEKAKPPMSINKLSLKQRFDDVRLMDMQVTVSALRKNE